jgi:hypothetical protein
MIKLNSLPANCAIFHTARGMTEVLCRLLAQGSPF